MTRLDLAFRFWNFWGFGGTFYTIFLLQVIRCYYLNLVHEYIDNCPQISLNFSIFLLSCYRFFSSPFFSIGSLRICCGRILERKKIGPGNTRSRAISTSIRKNKFYTKVVLFKFEELLAISLQSSVGSVFQVTPRSTSAHALIAWTLSIGVTRGRFLGSLSTEDVV